MKNAIITSLIISSFFSLCNSQTKEKKMEIKSSIKKNVKLIDGINLNGSLFKNNSIDLNKYNYNGTLIENLTIDNLLEKKYRDDFIKYLLIINKEDDNFKASLITQLLIIRIIQLSDSDAFYILSQISKNENISYNGIELYQQILLKFFIENPIFFIKQGNKYDDTTIIKNISNSLNEFFADEDFFKDNMVSINLDRHQLLLYPEKEQEFNDSFKKILKSLPKIEAIFSPSSYTAWKNKTLYFTNIYSLFEKKVTDNLTIAENVYYKFNILPVFEKYTSQDYIIQDPDGYTNLRKGKNTASEILQKIKTGEEINVLDKSNDWWYIQTKSGNKGYVYKTKIKSE